MVFRYLERHAGDYECMTVRGDQVVIERWDRGSDSRFEFNRHWVQTTFIEAQGGERGRLLLRSDGKKTVKKKWRSAFTLPVSSVPQWRAG
jgi:uncharacterized membrane protein